MTDRRADTSIRTAFTWALIATAVAWSSPLLEYFAPIPAGWIEFAHNLRAHAHWAPLCGLPPILLAIWRLISPTSKRSGLAHLNWEQFESAVAHAYLRRGYRVKSRVKAGADGGIDLYLRRWGRLYLVQCKHWKSKVGAPVIREMYGVLASDRKARGAIVVTSSTFTRDAIEFAKGKPIELVTGDQLLQMIKR